MDGGRDVVVDRNQVYACNIGVEIASEHFGKTTSNCTVTNNRISACHVGGIFLGGGDTGNGGVNNITISHNTLYQNDPTAFGGGQILMNNLVQNTTITGNVMVAGKTASGTAPLFILKDSTNGGSITVDYNIYAGVPAAGGAPTANVGFQWNRVDYVSFSAWRNATPHDDHSRFVEKPTQRIRLDEQESELRLLQPRAGM